MNHVAGDDERNSQSGLFYGSSLIAIENLRIALIENGSDHSGAHHAGSIWIKTSYRQLIELTDLLLQGHLLKKRFYTLLF